MKKKIKKLIRVRKKSAGNPVDPEGTLSESRRYVYYGTTTLVRKTRGKSAHAHSITSGSSSSNATWKPLIYYGGKKYGGKKYGENKYGKKSTEKKYGNKKYGKIREKKVRGKVTWLPVTSLLVKYAHGITSGSSSSLLLKCDLKTAYILHRKVKQCSILNRISRHSYYGTTTLVRKTRGKSAHAHSITSGSSSSNATWKPLIYYGGKKYGGKKYGENKYGKKSTEKKYGNKKYGKIREKKVRGKVTWLPVTSLLVKYAHGITSGSSSSLLLKCDLKTAYILHRKVKQCSILNRISRHSFRDTLAFKKA